MQYVFYFRNSKGPIDPTHSGCIGDAAAITGIAVLDGNYHNGGIGSGQFNFVMFYKTLESLANWKKCIICDGLIFIY